MSFPCFPKQLEKNCKHLNKTYKPLRDAASACLSLLSPTPHRSAVLTLRESHVLPADTPSSFAPRAFALAVPSAHDALPLIFQWLVPSCHSCLNVVCSERLPWWCPPQKSSPPPVTHLHNSASVSSLHLSVVDIFLFTSFVVVVVVLWLLFFIPASTVWKQGPRWTPLPRTQLDF